MEVVDRRSRTPLLLSSTFQVRAIKINVRADLPKLMLHRAIETAVISSSTVHDPHQIIQSDMLPDLTL
ncbi:MAG TPA: hypothetical protein VN985_09135 [Candidatus Eisenbacteria bacterium]|nr:hypothetical protein [Candidatus Eisenbacteria bacterium]